MADDTPDPDLELMRRVKRGDREAFGDLVDRYRQPIMNLAYRMTGDLSEAEDLAQTTFVQVHRFAHRFREGARFSTWLYTIARNLCLNEIRRRQRHPAESLDSGRERDDDRAPQQQPDPRSPSPPEDLLRGELEAKVQEALDDLPPNQRLALVLCRDGELSYEDMGKILHCSVSATKSLIHRGRETLKKRLKPYLSTGSWDVTDPPQQL